MAYIGEHQDTSNDLTWRQRLGLGAVLALLVACATTVGISAWLLNTGSGIAPAPAPVAPATPAMPTPATEQPPVLIPDNA